mgnify:CR=1 FL=1
MDINIVRETVTLVCFVIFVGIVLWAWSGDNRERFEEAARLPLDDEQPRQGRHSSKGTHTSGMPL